MSDCNICPIFNAYPDSIGGTLHSMVSFLKDTSVQGCFSSFYILPSLFHSDLDRGFCVIDYDLNESLAEAEDLESLRDSGISLMLDIVLNHVSANSPEFRDMLSKGEQSEYKELFINWNKFWEGRGRLGEEGYIIPDSQYTDIMFFRKPGLPVFITVADDGSRIPFWNTFYQKIIYENGERKYLGQMDLNILSEKTWEYYDRTLQKLAGYGAQFIRLDAFAYTSKIPGKRNFLNEPETWEILERFSNVANKYNLMILPEIHAGYGEHLYQTIANKGFFTYDFFLPGLILDALNTGDGSYLQKWVEELINGKIRTVNMLGCHDGIPLLDLKGLLPEERIEALIQTVVDRGGIIKDLHGKKNIYYQVNATYYSALGEDDRALILARAIQLFTPGKPQIWYLDLFNGKNDYEAVKRHGADGHKEINRTNLLYDDVTVALQRPTVRKQLELLRFRCSCPVFAADASVRVSCLKETMTFTWQREGETAVLECELKGKKYHIYQTGRDGTLKFEDKQE